MIMHNDGNNRRWFLFKGKLTPQNDNEILIDTNLKSQGYNLPEFSGLDRDRKPVTFRVTGDTS